MVRDPQSGQYTHPVVYIEYGSHEFWPSQFWDFYLAPAHDGNSYSFLTNTPPNLGEVENLLPEAWDRANVILRYNGKWGAYSHWPGDPPQGPPRHDQWTYPASSSVRWQLPKHLGH